MSVIQHKFQQFINKYNFTKYKTNHNMYKIINPYNKFVLEKNNKTSEHPNKIHILQKYVI